jgi:hypothetical protein
MSDLIRCSTCEGWGITSYEKDGSPNACERCGGAGKVPAPPPPVYIPSAREKERQKLEDLAESLKGSQLSDVAQLAQCVLDYLEGECDEFDY